MPKRLKKAAAKPATDVNISAFAAVQKLTGEGDQPAFADQLSAYMSALGKKGGTISGAKRMQMPAGERRRIASIAARAMWKKRNAAKKR